MTDDECAFRRWDPRSSHAGRLLERHLRRLQPQAVVRAALEALDRFGLDDLSVRLIAERLGVRAPALYWHFRNKRALLDEMAEAMLADRAAELAPPAEGEPWWEWLARSARWLRRALLAHRDGARVFAGATLPSLPTWLWALDLGLGVLRRAGFSWNEALRALAVVHVYVVGATIEEQAMPSPGTAEALLSEGFLARERYPWLAAGVDHLDRDPEAVFEHGLQSLLLGLRAGRREAPSS
ncbi:MAG TPA: TetR/AcrR family transcriptional regulator C-terminal domain-containing protein [Candidatus Dormibacteraeota bacterium]|nr:TetR/AcrR family transcriptional regulator C-terminal domain-containing protein [Candidatus Dormibacteraeota bacterium]